MGGQNEITSSRFGTLGLNEACYIGSQYYTKWESRNNIGKIALRSTKVATVIYSYCRYFEYHNNRNESNDYYSYSK